MECVRLDALFFVAGVRKGLQLTAFAGLRK